jgi:predicted ATPase/class 3 adenylate cyclase
LEAASSQKYTFLFTDIEGSTRLAQHFPVGMVTSLEKHNNILSRIFKEYNGIVFEIIGDAYCVAFDTSEDAVNSSVEVQRKLLEEDWGEAEIKVRMGIHTGFAQRSGDKFSGYITMARTHRIMSAANGGQVLLSQQVHDEVEPLLRDKVAFSDLGERRLKDLIQPVRIYQLTAEGLIPEFPPLKTLDARPNNLPVQLTSFIGREKELQQVKNSLLESRLLTLLGTGGSGKTRLALQAGAELIDNFANGVWFVQLEQVSDPILLPTAINNALGIQEESQKTPDESLAEYVKEKEILIILDNCEQIAEACANIAEKLLKRSPKLRMIVTSREALKCEGELTHRVNSLMIPVKNRKYSALELMEFESVKLFAERAQAVTPSFVLNEENARTVANICSDLDGIPLAIELAAARTKVLGVDKIYERLSDRFKLLTGGKRTALPRQQTLKALIDWSYDLLTEEEKTLWARLSVFSGGWSLEAAEEVCQDDFIQQYDILDLLFNLTEKSIVIYDSDNDRYKMLESIRQYGDEKLVQSENKPAIAAMHLSHFMSLAERSEKGLAGDDVKKWLGILETETGNMEAALNWSHSGGNNEEGGRLAVAFANYWLSRGYLTNAVYHLDNILNLCTELSNATRGNLLGITGLFSNMLGDSEKAEKLIDESLIISRELGNKDDIASGLNNLASVVYEKGDYTKARELIEETLAIDRESGDPSKISFSLINLGTVARLQGDFETARSLLEESLEIRKKAKNKFAIASSLNTLAILHLNLGEFDVAKSYTNESLTLARELGNSYGIADGLGLMGNVEAAIGNFESAEKFQNECLEIFEEMGKKNKIADTYSNLGNIAYQTGDNARSLELLDKALNIQRTLGDKFGIAFTLLRTGKTLLAEKRYEQALSSIDESTAIRSKLGLKSGIADCHNIKAAMLLDTGNFAEAAELYRKSAEIHFELRNKAGIFSCLLGLSAVLERSGKREDAVKLFSLGSRYIGLPGVAVDKFDKKLLAELIELDAEYSKLAAEAETGEHQLAGKEEVTDVIDKAFSNFP